MSKRQEPRVKLAKGESIITAFAHPCDGPGWSNTPVVVIIREVGGKLREDMMQPEELSLKMHTLFGISHAAHSAMTDAVHEKLTEKKQPKAKR